MNINTFTNYNAPGYSGYLKYGLNNLSTIKKVILLPPGTTIDTKANALLEATWTALRKGAAVSRIHPYPLSFEIKVEGGETIMQKTALSGSLPVRENPAIITLTYNVNQILATLLKNNNYKRWDVVFVDALGNIMGWTPDGTKFAGLSTTSVHFGQMSFNDGSKSAENQLTISLANPSEWNDAPALLQGIGLNWFPLAMEGTEAVKVTVISSTTAAFTVSVNAFGLDISDPRSAYVGLAKGDFVLTKGGVGQSLTGATMVDNADGTYTFTMTNTSGNFAVTLVNPPSAISVVAYNIECPVASTFVLA